jgi:hypothetical protein
MVQKGFPSFAKVCRKVPHFAWVFRLLPDLAPVPLHFRERGKRAKLAKSLMPSPKPSFFQHFKMTERFAKLRKLSKVPKLPSSH